MSLTKADTNEDKIKYRAFISYSHEDKAFVKEIVDILSNHDILPLWDEHIVVGQAFTEVIKEMIAYAHIFIPIITENSQNSYWVHQEIGYANALNIPILPIATDKSPSVMIAALQAIQINKAEDLRKPLKSINWENLILPYAHKTLSQIQIAEWPETRTELFVKQLEKSVLRGDYGKVRVQARLGSFSVPKEHYSHPIWLQRDGKARRGDYLHYLQGLERTFMEEHVRQKGCRLIVDPSTEEFNTSGTATRLEIFRDFLDSMSDKIEIVFSKRAHDTNLTIIGSSFLMESRIRRKDVGYLHNLLYLHPPTVLRYVRQFDQLFEQETLKKSLTVPNAIEEVDKFIEIAKKREEEPQSETNDNS